jgi:phosphate transport system substrate-binding protein
MKLKPARALWVMATCACVTTMGCGSPGGGTRSPSVSVTGAGSSFDQPLFDKAFSVYQRSHSIRINYQPLGSGAGQLDLNTRTVEFGAFDVPMLASDGFSNFDKIVQFPVALGGESVIYNLPQYTGMVRLSGFLLGQIYLGLIKHWSDPRLVALNPGLKALVGSSEDNITVVHRVDSSGSTYIFTDFLSRTNSTWASDVGTSKTPSWPQGVGVAKSTGVIQGVESGAGTIGYVESSYAVADDQHGVASAYVENLAGNFLLPSISGILADARQSGSPTTTSFSVVNAEGRTSYPITGYSWAGVYRSPSDWTRGKRACELTKALFIWETSKGQKYAPALDYATMPDAAQSYAASQLKTVKC